MSNPNASGSMAYTVDEDQRMVICPDGRQVRVKPTAYKLLAFLHRNPGRIYNHSQLLFHVWHDRYDRSPENVRIQVQNLRRWIAPDVIDTVPGYGYGVGINGCQQ